MIILLCKIYKRTLYINKSVPEKFTIKGNTLRGKGVGSFLSFFFSRWFFCVYRKNNKKGKKKSNYLYYFDLTIFMLTGVFPVMQDSQVDRKDNIILCFSIRPS